MKFTFASLTALFVCLGITIHPLFFGVATISSFAALDGIVNDQ